MNYNLEERYPMRLRPVCIDKIWGGERLAARYGKVSERTPLGESWELTVRPEGTSVVDNGVYAGRSLGELFGCTMREDGSDFPLLVKFIDAGDRLSVQVHPKKTELWYIVEADEGAEIIYGFSTQPDEEAFRAAAAEEGGVALDAMLHRVPVRRGELYLLPSGLVHAIGGGILIAEIQENSNLTARVFDYGRGREVQPEEATRAIFDRRCFFPSDAGISAETHKARGAECRYFRTQIYDAERGDITVPEISENTFLHLLFTEGEGTVAGGGVKTPYRRGESFIIPAHCRDFCVIPSVGTRFIATVPRGINS